MSLRIQLYKRLDWVGLPVHVIEKSIIWSTRKYSLHLEICHPDVLPQFPSSCSKVIVSPTIWTPVSLKTQDRVDAQKNIAKSYLLKKPSQWSIAIQADTVRRVHEFSKSDFQPWESVQLFLILRSCISPWSLICSWTYTGLKASSSPLSALT